MDVEIKIVEQASVELAHGLTRLLPQLLGKEHVVNVDTLNIVLSQPGVKLFVALLGNEVVGTAQLSVIDRLYAPIAWVDGVVVDENQRGKGIAGKLMQGLLDAARELGLHEVCLTSNPKREAANHLYTKLGFEFYETNYYRYKF